MDLDFKDPKGYMLSGFASHHKGGGDYNENNAGLGYMHPSGWAGGVYKNSLGKPSAYLTKEIAAELAKLGPVKLKGILNMGGVTGYGNPITPVLLPGLLAEMGDTGVSLNAVPPIKGQTPLTLALQLRKKF